MPHFFPRALPRTATGRMAALTLVAAGVTALGAGVLPRLLEAPAAQRPSPWASARPAPAEPGLFHFPDKQAATPPVFTPATTEAAPLPASPTAKPPARQAALPAGVERFESCKPACESRDPAKHSVVAQPGIPPAGGMAPALAGQAPLQILPQVQAQAPDVPRPPLPVGVREEASVSSEPNLVDRTLGATRDMLSSVTDQVKTAIRAPW